MKKKIKHVNPRISLDRFSFMSFVFPLNPLHLHLYPSTYSITTSVRITSTLSIYPMTRDRCLFLIMKCEAAAVKKTSMIFDPAKANFLSPNHDSNTRSLPFDSTRFRQSI